MALPEYRDGPAGLGCWIPLLGVGFLRIGIRTFQGLRFRFSGLFGFSGSSGPGFGFGFKDYWTRFHWILDSRVLLLNHTLKL